MAARSIPAIRVEPLNKTHDRNAFSCGSEPLDRYFKTQASQDVKRRVAKCSVAVDEASGEIVGFYTLSATSLALSELPEATMKALPKYPVLPAVLLGRLAVASPAQGRKLGQALLAHAADEKQLSALMDKMLTMAQEQSKKNGQSDPIKTKEYRGAYAYQVDKALVARFGEWLIVTNKQE